MINKQSPLPIYHQILEDLKKRIEQKEFQPGDIIPSERELSESYNVSRMTVRQAVTNMVNDGDLYRERGKGTFVAERKIEQPLQGMTSFTEDMRQRGMIASSKLIVFETTPVPDDIAHKLQLDMDQQVYNIKRIRYADNKPMAVETTFIHTALIPDLTEELVQGSLYHYIEDELNLEIEKASQMIEATIADHHLSDLLEIPPSSAILHMERNSFLKDGRPFEVVKSAYRADRYKFISDIHRT